MSQKELRMWFGLDSTKPRARQVMLIVLQCSVIFGGPLLGLTAINFYPFLASVRTLLVGALSSACLFFLLSFALFRRNSDLFAFPILLRLVFRFGWAVASTFLVWGFIGIVNGAGTRLEPRRAPVVAKHPTLERDPARRTYNIALRPWRGSRTVLELPGPRSTYDQLQVPIDAIDTPQSVLDNMPDKGEAKIIVGKGRLGLEWLKNIEPISEAVDSGS